MKTYTIVVLNDGETYSSMEGCEILVLDEKAMRMIEDGEVRVVDIKIDCPDSIKTCIGFDTPLRAWGA